MEMHLIDQLAIGLERLYIAVPSVLSTLFEVIWEASSFSCLLGKELYKSVLLLTSIIRGILYLLLYFFHFDPPTFETVREMACIHLDPDATSHQTDRLALENIIARLKADSAMLLKQNDELSARVISLETYARGIEASLSQQEDAACQLLLGVLACRSLAPSPVPRLQSPKLQLGFSPNLLDSSRVAEDTDVIRTHDATSQLFVELLTLRREAKSRAEVVTSMTSANGHLKEALRHSEDISQTYLVELLTIRKEALVLRAENTMKTRLAMISVDKQEQKIQTIQAEYQTTTEQILVQTLTLRRQLFGLVVYCKSILSRPAPPVSAITLMAPSDSMQSLTTQLEALRLSEAETRAEKDSLANALSDVLTSLRLPDLFITPVREDGPIKELVLALAFTWKMSRRKSPAMAKLNEVHTDKVHKETDLTLRGEQTRTLPPGIPSDSVRARAFRLGPPKNKSAFPIQEPKRHRSIHDVHTSINFDPHLSRGLTQILDSQPQFPPGISLPLSLGGSLVPIPIHQNVIGPQMESLYPNPIHPPRSTIMSRGGYNGDPYNTASFHHDGQVRHDSAIGYLGFAQPIESHGHAMDVAQSDEQGVPFLPFSAS